MLCHATFDPGMTYRYRLSRVWNPAKESLVWIMLNPSTADARKDDPTIKRCIQFSINQSFGGLVVVNLFALRATDPKDLELARDPIGPDNDAHLQQVLASKSRVCCAWGNIPARFKKREAEVLTLLRDRTLYCLKKNQDGSPAHPLYLAGNLTLSLYRGVE